MSTPWSTIGSSQDDLCRRVLGSSTLHYKNKEACFNTNTEPLLILLREERLGPSFPVRCRHSRALEEELEICQHLLLTHQDAEHSGPSTPVHLVKSDRIVIMTIVIFTKKISRTHSLSQVELALPVEPENVLEYPGRAVEVKLSLVVVQCEGVAQGENFNYKIYSRF